MRETKRSLAAMSGVALTIACLLAAGCGGAGGTAPASTVDASFASASSAMPELNIEGTNSGLELFVLPDQEHHPVLEAIDAAETSVDVQVYMLSDDTITQGLIKAAERGVKVRVLLEPRPFNPGNPGSPLPTNQQAVRAFQGTKVQYDWSSPAFVFTHQKSMIVDKKVVWIMTANMSKTARANNREYLILDSNRSDVAEAQRIFDSDWTNKPYTPGAGAKHLVISPNNSRQQLLTLINAAHRQISAGVEVMGDPELKAAFIAKAKAGVKVQFLLADPTKYPTSDQPQHARDLQAGGVEVKYIAKPVFHAKLIIVDNQAAYTGSINFTTNSMNNNRELGVIITQPNVIKQMVQIHAQDWAAGGPIG